ncbi:putative O-methyltransferase [Melia azedarach]|uniref:O-methyltransferase n=1 Tax=Melia azedarach TaxID=155640 RepID=A0ACC1Z1C8_MELAZ|nr:putative O-methyltransferase [Melia azedarach]
MASVAEAEASLKGQAEIWLHMFAFVDSLALKCAIELRIPDIIHSHGRPITLSQISSCIDSSSPEISYLERLMRFLVRKKIFTEHHPSDGGQPLYGLTHSSKWLVTDSEGSGLGSVFLVENYSYVVNSWHFLSQAVKKGGIAIEKAYGGVVCDLASKDEEFNNIFNDGMACNSKILTKEIVTGYKDGYDSLKSLIDVAGGIGGLISEIVKTYPHIKGINFDLPHVINTAPAYRGVTHISGDMFDVIPNADAVLLKWVLHNWSDEACVKILKNCRKAIPEKTGKVIIVDVVLQADGKGLFDDAGFAFDLVMMVNTPGGKERTEAEWKKILEEGGFPRYKIIKIPALQSIIEAYPG